jgi:hypothetical protein
MAEITCRYCGTMIGKDTYALNLKLLGREINEFACLSCLADYLATTEDVLLIKIEEFKDQGCKLFD